MRALQSLLLTAMLAGAMTASLHAQGEPFPLDTLRVNATSRAAAEVVSGTRAVEVIGADEIRRSPARNVADLLQWAFNVETAPRSPALVDVSVRGSSFEQILVLVDGIRASDAQTGHFDMNLAVPLDQIERVEIVRGPGSALHGADAMGGVVHIVTRRGSGSSAKVEGGSFGTLRLAGAHAARLGGTTLDLAADLQRSDGHREGTDYETGIARLALAREVGGRTLRGDVAYAARDFGADGFYGPFPSYERTRTATTSLFWRGDPQARLSIEPALNARWNGDDYILRRADPSFYRNEHTTLQAGGELLARYVASPSLRFAGGVEAYTDRLNSARLGDRSESRGALLAEAAAGSVGTFTGTAGLRLDVHDAFGPFLSPALASAWWPVPALRIRGSVARSFRTPTWTERYYRDPANIGDPSLGPERAWGAELGFDAYPVSRFRLGAAAFVRAAEDLIDWARPLDQSAVPWNTRNVEEATYRGLEVEAAVDDFADTRLVARGSWLSLESSEAAGFLSKYALRPVVEAISFSADREIFRGFAVLLRGQRARRTGESAYLRIDGRATYSFSRAGGRIYVDFANATNESYPDITGAGAPGRSLAVGLEWARR